MISIEQLTKLLWLLTNITEHAQTAAHYLRICKPLMETKKEMGLDNVDIYIKSLEEKQIELIKLWNVIMNS